MNVKTTEYFRDVRVKMTNELWLEPTQENQDKIKLWDAIHGIDWWDEHRMPHGDPLAFRNG